MTTPRYNRGCQRGNEATLPARALPALRASCPSNVVILRQRGAWSTQLVCAWLIRRIGNALAPYLEQYQPILVFDASKTHTTPFVFAACARAHIWGALVAAKCTFFKQPLDTHGFLAFKRCLRREYQLARVRTSTADLPIDEFPACLYKAIREVVQGTRWAIAFDEDGFSPGQGRVCRRIVDRLGASPAGQVPTTRPTAADLALCFPRRTRIPTAQVWRPFDHVAAAGPAAPGCTPLAGLVRPVSDAVAAPAPRTRAEHRAAAAAEAAASASASASAAPPTPAMAPASAKSAPRVFGRTRSQTALLARVRPPLE